MFMPIENLELDLNQKAHLLNRNEGHFMDFKSKLIAP
jgi:hypothetical protein